MSISATSPPPPTSPRPDDYNLVQTIKLQKLPFGRVRFAQHRIFPCVLITSHPCKTFRIMENNKQLIFCLQWNQKFWRHLWWCSIFYETIAGSVFCEVLHSEAIRRKRDHNTHQHVAFLEGVLSPSTDNKGEAEAGALNASRCDLF